MEEKYLSYGEIHNQYGQLQQTLEYIKSHQAAIRDFFPEKGDIVFIACGSSYWLSLSAKSTFIVKTGRNAFSVKAGDVLLNEDEYVGRFDNPTFLCPSRSGSTTEVLEAIAILKKLYPQAKLLSLVEYQGSQLEQAADLCLSMPWANEESVCQTRSFSCLYLACVLMADILAGSSRLFQAAERYLAAAPEYYRRDIPVLRKIVEENSINRVISLGSGVQYGVSIEGAYIVIEVAAFTSHYFQMLEYRHGPIVMTDKQTAIFLASSQRSKEYEKTVIQEAQKYTDLVYLVTAKPSDLSVAHQFVLEDDSPDEIVALHFVFCLQSVAYRLAVKTGKNPDFPGDLVPYIQL